MSETTPEGLALLDRICDAVDQLTPIERDVFASYSERMSLREISRELGVGRTTVSRIRDRAVLQLRALLEGDPLVQERLGV